MAEWTNQNARVKADVLGGGCLSRTIGRDTPTGKPPPSIRSSCSETDSDDDLDAEEYRLRVGEPTNVARMPSWRPLPPRRALHERAIITLKGVMIAVVLERWRPKLAVEEAARKLLESAFGLRDEKDVLREARCGGDSFIAKVIIDVRYGHWWLVSTRVTASSQVVTRGVIEVERSPKDGGIGAGEKKRNMRENQRIACR